MTLPPAPYTLRRGDNYGTWQVIAADHSLVGEFPSWEIAEAVRQLPRLIATLAAMRRVVERTLRVRGTELVQREAVGQALVMLREMGNGHDL